MTKTRESPEKCHEYDLELGERGRRNDLITKKLRVFLLRLKKIQRYLDYST